MDRHNFGIKSWATFTSNKIFRDDREHLLSEAEMMAA